MTPVTRIYRVLLHSLDNHGVVGSLSRAAARLRPGAASPAASHPEPTTPHPFDTLHGTDTGGYIPGADISSGLRNADLYNTAYYGISPSTLTQALTLLGPLPPGTTFVDLGCGKGRALLVASAFPFAHLLGVDLSAELCTIARANATLLALPNVTILQQDATTLTYPDGPLVVYLYHPFLKPLLRRVLANLTRQRARSPHPTFLLDANPQYPRLIAQTRFFHPLWDHLFLLSPEDAAADRHGTTNERYTLFKAEPTP